MKAIVNYILFCFFVLTYGICVGQTNKNDSPRHLLKTAKEDTDKVNLLNKLSKKSNSIGNYDTALFYAEEARSLALKLGFKKGLAASYNNTGNVRQNQVNLTEALKNYFASLRLYEEMGNKKGIASAYNGLGNTYNNQGNYPEALKNHFSALNIRKIIGDKEGLSASYGNIGNVYENQGNYSESLKNHFLSLKIDEELGDRQGVATSYNNIGNIYGRQENYGEALKNYFGCLKIFEALGDKYGIETLMANIGATYMGLKNFKEALAFSLKALDFAKEIGDMEGIKDVNNNLSQVYSATGNDKKALDHYKAYIAARDSIFNEENTKKNVQTEMQYEFDKKEAGTKLEQEKKEAIATAESKKQKVIIWSVCGILLLVFCFAVFAYRSYLQKQKINIEITKQKHLIEEKQKEILDSIYYARRIQRSLLTSEKYIEKNLKRIIK